MKRILDKWIAINPHEYLLVNSKGLKLNPTTLYQRLSKLFQKDASVNMLRKMVYTEGYGVAYAKHKQIRKNQKKQ